jgi:hypothetical protein
MKNTQLFRHMHPSNRGSRAMKKILFTLLVTLSTSPAFADGGYGHAGGRGGDHGGGGGWWIIPALIGGAMVYELTRPQPQYDPPSPVYVQPPPQIYAPSLPPPSNAPQVASVPAQYWYFCAASNGYYPYVRSCPTGWQTVPTIPPVTLPSASYGPPPPPSPQ